MSSYDPYEGIPHIADAQVSGLATLNGHAKRPTLADLLLARDDLADLPSPEPLITDTIDRRTVAVVAGHYGTCKSFLLQDWAACVATGKRWQGRETSQGKVVYIASEGAYGLHGRFSSWEYAWRKDIPSERLLVLPVPVSLADVGLMAELCAIVKDVDLVVVDTLARCLVGADENSARDMGMAVDALYQLRDATGGGTIAVAHHTGKDRTTIRGSSALEAGVDTVYKTEGDTRHLVVSRTKRKEGPTEDTLQLQLKAVAGTDSAILSALVANMRGGPSADDLLSHFISHYSEMGATKSDLVATSGLAKSSVYRAINDLIKDGLLRLDGKQHGGRLYLAGQENGR